MGVEILKEAVEYAQSRKWIVHVPLLPIAPVSRVLGVSRAQLTLRMKASDNKPDKRHQRLDEAVDAEVLSRILNIIGDMPTYGDSRVWAIE